MSESSKLTRHDLSKIAGNNLRIIRALENVLKSVPENTVDNDSAISFASSRANAALVSGIKNSVQIKGMEVLQWLSM